MAEPNIRIILYEIRVRIVRNVRNLYIFIAFRTFVFSFKFRTRISYTFRTFVFRTRISDNFVRISYNLYKSIFKFIAATVALRRFISSIAAKTAHFLSLSIPHYYKLYFAVILTLPQSYHQISHL